MSCTNDDEEVSHLLIFFITYRMYPEMLKKNAISLMLQVPTSVRSQRRVVLGTKKNSPNPLTLGVLRKKRSRRGSKFLSIAILRCQHLRVLSILTIYTFTLRHVTNYFVHTVIALPVVLHFFAVFSRSVVINIDTDKL